MRGIDLNCDLGEGMPSEAELMALVSSASIACGGHAGDGATMRTSVQLALRHRVSIGAHPSFVDRAHFGRRERPAAPAEVYELVLTQTRALQMIALAEGARLRHVKLHGALYNQAMRDEALAGAVVEAVGLLDPELILFAPAGSVLLHLARTKRIRTVSEVFADRTYQPDGSLTPRHRPEALITDVSAAVAQVLRLVRDGQVRAVDGTEVSLLAETVCVHGDSAQALALARGLRVELERAGLIVRAPAP